MTCRHRADDLDHRVGERRELVRRNGEGRRQVDDRSERTHEHALRDEAAPQRVDVVDAVEFDHADRAHDADVAHAGHVAAGREPGAQRLLDRRDLRQPRLALEQVERGIGGGAGQRVRHVGRAVHQRVGRIVRPEGIEHLVARQRRGERQRARR